MPTDLPPWGVVYQQSQRWMAAGCFEAITHDLRSLLRLLAERLAEPSAVIFDARTLQSSVESGQRGRLRRLPEKEGEAKCTWSWTQLGHLLAAHVTPANAQKRAQVGALAARKVQELTGEAVEVAYADQGYTGEEPASQSRRAWH